MVYCDFCEGRRFRFGTVEGKKVIIVMTGLSMVLISYSFWNIPIGKKTTFI